MEINIQKLRYLIKNDKTFAIKRNSPYLYHGIYIPSFKDVTPIISIIENGILSIHNLEKIGI